MNTLRRLRVNLRMLGFMAVVLFASLWKSRRPAPLPPHSLRGGYPFKGPI